MNTRKPLPAVETKRHEPENHKAHAHHAHREAQEEDAAAEWEEVQMDDLVDELECARAQVYQLQVPQMLHAFAPALLTVLFF